MIGGDRRCQMARSIFETLTCKGSGWSRVGPGWLGHFTKMIHNGIDTV